MRIEGVERIGRIVAVVVGSTGLALIFVGPANWWGALGLIPLAMGLSGW